MSNKTELSLEPVDGELLPTGKMPTLTADQVNVLTIIQSVSKVEVLANAEETAAGIERMKASYLPIVEKAKTEIANAKTKADFERSQAYRLAIRDERLGFTKTIDAELAARKSFIKIADDSKKLVEKAFKSLEIELDEAEKPVDDRLKAAAAAKKALADAIAKLKAHTINPLLPAANIETAINDFRLSFGDTDYQESKSVAESIFEAKITEFQVILSAAVVREENERKIKEQEKQAQQRANINVTFPIAEISGYAARSSVDIQSRIDWTDKVDMIAFDLVLTEAETAKQSCLNMLNAFLPMAIDREAKEREKQYQNDWDLAIQENSDRLDWGLAIQEDSDRPEDVMQCHPLKLSITRKPFLDDPDICDSGDCSGAHHADELEVVEVVSEPVADDYVSIPVRHLQALIYAADQYIEYPELHDCEKTRTAIIFAKSLI